MARGSQIPGKLWPVLGSIFMFRMIVYLYGVKHRTGSPEGIPQLFLAFFRHGFSNISEELFKASYARCRTTRDLANFSRYHSAPPLQVGVSAAVELFAANRTRGGSGGFKDSLLLPSLSSGVRPDDHLPTMRRKLAPFSVPVMRWSLEQIRDHASAQGARMIIVLVASPIDRNLTASDFNKIRHCLDGIEVPMIDLRDTFRLQDLSEVQPTVDFHPNARGHEMIFENLYANLPGQPTAWAALVGSGAN